MLALFLDSLGWTLVGLLIWSTLVLAWTFRQELAVMLLTLLSAIGIASIIAYIRYLLR